eukprot:m.100151 g.100151  ORF g.100151 m.100151 type:complete len:228 (+) comp14050_c0_seq7:2041-2724(+)
MGNYIQNNDNTMAGRDDLTAVVPQLKRNLGITKFRAKLQATFGTPVCRELLTLRNNVKALKRLLPQVLHEKEDQITQLKTGWEEIALAQRASMTYGNLLWAAARTEATVGSMVSEGAIEMLLLELATNLNDWLGAAESSFPEEPAEPTFRENHLTSLLGILSSRSTDKITYRSIVCSIQMPYSHTDCRCGGILEWPRGGGERRTVSRTHRCTSQRAERPSPGSTQSS